MFSDLFENSQKIMRHRRALTKGGMYGDDLRRSETYEDTAEIHDAWIAPNTTDWQGLLNRELTTETYTLYATAPPDVKSGDRLTVQGESWAYRVDGEPQKWESPFWGPTIGGWVVPLSRAKG